MKRAIKLIGFRLAFVLFALGALVFNFFCIFIACFPATAARRRFVRRTAGWLIRLWFGILDRCGITHRDIEGLPQLPQNGGLIVANHPSLADVLLIIGLRPDVTCIIKSAIRYNPFYGLIARCAGYISNDQGIDLVRESVNRVRAGETVFVFPEGTRTAQDPINPLQPGFALIATRAKAPIIPIVITLNQPILAKGQPLFALHRLPVGFRVRTGETFPADHRRTPRELAASVEKFFHEALRGSTAESRDSAIAAPSPENHGRPISRTA